jgi:hypothetical protein
VDDSNACVLVPTESGLFSYYVISNATTSFRRSVDPCCPIHSQPTLNTKARQNEHEHIDPPPQKRHPRAHLVVSCTVHGSQSQSYHTACQHGLDPADYAVYQRHDPDPAQRLLDGRTLRSGGSSNRSAGAGFLVRVWPGKGRAQLHEDSPAGGEDVDGAVEEQRPVQREAPDVGRIVEVVRDAGGGADGPVQGGPSGGNVVVRDYGRGGGHCGLWWRCWRGEGDGVEVGEVSVDQGGEDCKLLDVVGQEWRVSISLIP